MLSRPLTDLLKKDVFGWTSEGIQTMKDAMTITPVLALPNMVGPFT